MCVAECVFVYLHHFQVYKQAHTSVYSIQGVLPSPQNTTSSILFYLQASTFTNENLGFFSFRKTTPSFSVKVFNGDFRPNDGSNLTNPSPPPNKQPLFFKSK